MSKKITNKGDSLIERKLIKVERNVQEGEHQKVSKGFIIMLEK